MPTKSVHYASEHSPRQFGKTFRMNLRPVKPCAPIKVVGWRKYNEYLIWKCISMPIYNIYKVPTSRIPQPAIAANIAMFQVDFPTHIVMWLHRLVSNFTEPMTPPRNRSPSFEYVASGVSRSSSPVHVPSPPITHYSSSSLSYLPSNGGASNSDVSCPSSPVPLSMGELSLTHS
jgi:hypothetical protein